MNSTIERMGVVLPQTPGAWDSGSTAAPIVWKEEGRYFMLYQGWKEGTGPRIFGLATSDDGLKWEKHSKNPVMTPSPGQWDQGGFECGCVLKIDDYYRLYYSGHNGDGKLRIGMANSTNLIEWEKHDQNPIMDSDPQISWESKGVAFPAVVRDSRGYTMIYGAYGPNSMELGVATSSDGIAWNKHPHNPILPQRGWWESPDCKYWDAGIEVHQTFATGDFYVTLYEGFGKPYRYNIGVAYSPDGIVWARSPENPLFPLTGPNVRQDMSVVHPMLLIEDMLLYYVELEAALGFSAAPHRICAARISPDVLNPLAQRSLSFPLWTDRTIESVGDTTSQIPTEGFERKTFYVSTDEAADVYIEIDPSGLEQWKVLEQDKVVANKLWTHVTTHDFHATRIRIVPTGGQAIMSAWLVLGNGA